MKRKGEGLVFIVAVLFMILIIFLGLITAQAPKDSKAEKAKCREQAHKIIHISATEAATSAAALSQFPGADNIALAIIIGKMTVELSVVYDIHLTGTAVEIGKGLLKHYSVIIALRWGSQWLVGWIPGAGNAVNAASMFALVEYVGWGVANDFEEQKFGRR